MISGETKYFTFENSTTDVTSIALSFYSGLFAYNGWNYLNFIIEELKDPIVNLPRAIYISCTLVTVVYVLTNVAFYTTLSPAEVLNSEAVAVTFANRIFGPIAWTLPVFVALSTFGGVNGIILTTSRLFYAGACEGQMPEILTMIQVTKMTPTPAVLTIAFLSLLYLMSSNIFALINYVGFATWTFANRIFGPIAWTLPVFVALSTFGGVNGIILTTSRVGVNDNLFLLKPATHYQADLTFANRIFGPIAWTLPVFVALSTFGGVNGIILTTSR
ncbi:large neutral amino acids transporter small subunit 2-like [Diaphorina citri]|uniref:Large neutral amino acids transporter small subunit 2-like n=1 Tax=Diaphorina citri TaxID=121845 RepID=A0A3Q0IV39_DIACI|nr:large neutral amino acids transporter small subunit 2-like [Diaphorina citri]